MLFFWHLSFMWLISPVSILSVLLFSFLLIMICNACFFWLSQEQQADNAAPGQSGWQLQDAGVCQCVTRRPQCWWDAGISYVCHLSQCFIICVVNNCGGVKLWINQEWWSKLCIKKSFHEHLKKWCDIFLFLYPYNSYNVTSLMCFSSSNKMASFTGMLQG